VKRSVVAAGKTIREAVRLANAKAVRACHAVGSGCRQTNLRVSQGLSADLLRQCFDECIWSGGISILRSN